MLKVWPEDYTAIAEGRKLFEYRKDDRRFNVGDILILLEFDPNGSDKGEFTGRGLRAKVTYTVRNEPGVPDGYVVMSLERETKFHHARGPRGEPVSPHWDYPSEFE